MPRLIGSNTAITSAPACLRDVGDRVGVFDAAEEVRLLQDDGGRLVVDRRGERVGVDHAARAIERHDLGVEIFQIRRDRLPVLGMQARRYDDLRALAGGVQAMSTASAAELAPSYRLALATAMPVSRVMSDWYSNIACRLPWLASA